MVDVEVGSLEGLRARRSVAKREVRKAKAKLRAAERARDTARIPECEQGLADARRKRDPLLPPSVRRV